MTPAEKMDWLLEHILNTTSAAQAYRYNFFPSSQNWNTQANDVRVFFESVDELGFYIKALASSGFLEELKNGWYQLTVEGLNRVISLQEEGVNSTLCFVAMSFKPEDEALFDEAIVPACEATGFHAFRTDRDHHATDVSINDRILSEIKRSRFCIADFSTHSNGVYFEAGYALGRGLKVIYTCRKSEFGKAHFDTSHYPHILYETHEELKQRLIDKINAWIKD